MKRKLLSILLVVFGTLVLASCVEVSDIRSIAFESTPKTVYLLDEELEPFTVRVETKDGEEHILSSTDERVTITGFSSEVVGSFTMTIVVDELTNIGINFLYTVISSLTDGLFAGGLGTVEDPYEITNAQELSNIRLALDKHFILMNNIDLTGIEWSPIGSVTITSISTHAISVAINEGFSGSFDGNNMAIQNMTSNSQSDSLPVALFVAVFGDSGEDKAVIKDLSIEDIDFDVQYAVSGLTFYAVNVHFDNIVVTGNMRGRGGSGIANIVQGEHSIIENVRNEANITSHSQNYYTFIGGIVSQTALPSSGLVEIRNAVNTGNLTHEYLVVEGISSGTIAGQILAQATQGSNGRTIIHNSSGTGVITGNLSGPEDNTSHQFYGRVYLSESELSEEGLYKKSDYTAFFSIEQQRLFGANNLTTKTLLEVTWDE